MIFVLCTVPWRCALKILETECHPISSSAVVCVEHRSSCSKSKHQKISWFIFICGRLAIVALHERWQWCANDMKIEPGNIRKSNPEAYHHGPEILKEACTFQLLLKVIADRICPHHFFQMSSIHDWIAYVWPHFLLRLCVVFFLDWWIWSTLCVLCLLSWLKRIDVSFFLLSFLFVWESCVFHFYDNFLHRSIVCFVRWLRRFADNSRCTVSTVSPASRVACGFNLLEIHGKK